MRIIKTNGDTSMRIYNIVALYHKSFSNINGD